MTTANTFTFKVEFFHRLTREHTRTKTIRAHSRYQANLTAQRCSNAWECHNITIPPDPAVWTEFIV